MTEGRGSDESGDPDVRYSDYVAVGQNAFEFRFDFGRLESRVAWVHVHTRIVMSPTRAKELARLIEGAISRYERVYGAIADTTPSDDDVQ